MLEAFNINDLEDAFEPTSLSSPAIVCISNCMHTTESLIQAVSPDANGAALRWCGVHFAYFDATGVQPSNLDAGWMMRYLIRFIPPKLLTRAVFP